MSLELRCWSEEEFAHSKDPWDRLLAGSDADPLFMSWDWQWRWWRHHGAALDAALHLLALYAGERLVALAPFYSRRVLARGLLRGRRVEILGIAWRDPHTVFSDYLDLIVAREHGAAAIARIAAWLEAERFWDELVLACTPRDGLACALVRGHLAGRALIREVDPASAWCACLPATFEEYVASLRSDARRKLLNHRTRLVSPELRAAAAADVAGDLELLWRFSRARWGELGLSAAAREFYLDLALGAVQRGDLRLTRLTSAGRPLSVMYNLRRGATVYYLQSGFDPSGARGLSPGYLHFGFAIEAACREGATRFDLLAGRGRHRDYKQDLLAKEVPVVTYHVVRARLARALYGAYESVRGLWRR
ncbi:MAG TPA: GNAT family N-acetyltransferase [Steroidobacteraceae bacterium]|nr:GNAT family N-acetyltransferase [Steroidobacteraceae bacterium]